MRNVALYLGAACLMALSGAACSSADAGEGTVRFTTWGEAYIEQEIPAADVEDGWTIKYDRFLVTFGDIQVVDAASAPAATMTGTRLYDMHAPAGEKAIVTFPGLAAKAYAHVSYMIEPATSATELAEGVADAEKQFMIRNGYSVYVEASATKGAVTKTYKWGFKNKTLFDDCKGDVSGKETDGVIVKNGGTDIVQLTIHGDHLYYDDLQAKEAKVRFDNIANADRNNDGIVTLEELGVVKLTSIPKENGPYGTGSAAGINDLRAFVEALSRTIGHYRGEGECIASAK